LPLAGRALSHPFYSRRYGKRALEALLNGGRAAQRSADETLALGATGSYPGVYAPPPSHPQDAAVASALEDMGLESPADDSKLKVRS